MADLFSANLVLTGINKTEVRYRVEKPQGVNVLGFHHVVIDRKNFPEDDDFNMDFMGMDLNNPPKPVDPNEIPDKKAVKDLKKKQAGFRKFMNFKVTISGE